MGRVIEDMLEARVGGDIYILGSRVSPKIKIQSETRDFINLFGVRFHRFGRDLANGVSNKANSAYSGSFGSDIVKED